MEENFIQSDDTVIIQVLWALKEKIIIVIGIMLCCSLISWTCCSFFITPKYEASVNMIVNSKTDVSGSITNDNISSAEKLVNTYAIIIKSNKVLNQVIAILELNMTYRELYQEIDVEAINNTQVMKISVCNEDSVLAQNIVKTISEIAPDIVVDAVEAGSCKVVSWVECDKTPVFPNVKKITVLTGVFSLCWNYYITRNFK